MISRPLAKALPVIGEQPKWFKCHKLTVNTQQYPNDGDRSMTAETWLDWIKKNAGALSASEPIGIGDGQRCLSVTCQTGDRFFVKTFQGSLAEEQCQAECHGLSTLWQTNRQTPERLLQVAKPLATGHYWFITELIEAQAPSSSSWQVAGEGLAELHRQTRPTFGLDRDNFCGPTPQPNTPSSDGYQFFASQRLQHQATINHQAGLFLDEDVALVDKLCRRLPDLIPEQPASLIHGDLWQGNLLFNQQGQAMLIDPACYYGWAEAELAMTTLFGGFDKMFFEAYQHHSDIDLDWRERAPIYNLYHLLNHLYLFGQSYYAEIKSTLHRFT